MIERHDTYFNGMPLPFAGNTDQEAMLKHPVFSPAFVMQDFTPV
jgi:hypothetical protein